MKLRTHHILVAVASCVYLWGKEVQAQDACPLYAPVIDVMGVQWYTDSKASIVDPAKAAENHRLQKDLQNFTNGLSGRLDRLLESRLDTDVTDCIQKNLTAWANASALSKTPTWSVQLAEQTKANVALQFIFLKLGAMGVQPPDKVRNWRRDVLLTLLKAYDDIKYRGNLYVWSGVAAASEDLLEHDEHLRRYHDAVWKYAIDVIGNDGTLEQEMGRGRRALIYHTFFYNALSALWNMRNALRTETSPSDLDALRRLSKAVGEAACEPSEFARQAGAQQEELDRWNIAMAASFAKQFNTEAWTRCTKAPDRSLGAGWGGRFDLTVKSLEVVGERRR